MGHGQGRRRRHRSDFELPGTGDKTYRLADYRGSNLVLAFYPGDATTICTKQFCSYRDQGDGSTGSTRRCWASSPQSVDSHELWAREQELMFPCWRTSTSR